MTNKIILTAFAIQLSALLFGQQLCFDPANDNRYDTYESCLDVVVVDFNNDGNLDVLVAGGSLVSIHLGNGDGTFDPYTTTPPGTNKHMELVDFDNDGDLDMFTYASGNLTAGRNNGDGTMEWLGYLGISINGSGTSFMAVGDITGDGRAEVVVNDAEGSDLYVYEMDEFGVPISTFTIDTPDQPYAPAIGDLNGDNIMDVACALGSSDNVAIYFGEGNGVFTEVLTDAGISIGSGLSHVEIADFNGDDENDLAVAGTAEMFVVLNNGNETFSPSTSFFMGTYCYGSKTGDWDNDDDIDVAWANGTNGGVTIKLNDGDGTFDQSPFTLISANGSAQELATGDFNGDGNLDIIVANAFDGNFAFLKGWGDGHFGTRALLTLPNPSGLTYGDFDNDGDIDLIATNPGPFGNSFFSFNLNNGDGSFADTEYIETVNGSGECVAADFNNDDELDLVIHTPYGYVFHFGNGNGTFDPYVTFDTNNLGEGGDRTCAVGDFNGDGLMDVTGSRPGANTVSVIMNNGNSTFTAPTLLEGSGYPRTLMTADYNNDDNDDIIVCSNTTDEVWIYFSNGDGTFSAPLILSTAGQPEGLTAFDANEDGVIDLVVGSPNLNKLYCFISNNDGTFDTAIETDIPTGSSSTRLAHADMNGDSHEDIIAAFYQDDAAGVFFGHGDGTFDSAINYALDQQPSQIVSADFNNDGSPDISSLNSGSFNVSVVLNNAAFINADGELAFCEGESVTLSASEGYSYLWSNGATTQSISATENGEFYCSITNQSGSCTLVTPSVIVEVFQGAEVTLDLDSTVVCYENGSFFLTGGQPFGGLYTGEGVTANVFDPTAVGPGTYTITYNYSDIGECTVGSATDVVIVDICFNINDVNFSPEVYPTMTNDIVTISCNGAFACDVMDAKGTLVKSFQKKHNLENISIGDLSEGIYFLKISQDEKSHVVRVALSK